MAKSPLKKYEEMISRCLRCSMCKWIPQVQIKNKEFATICPAIDYYNFHIYSGGGKLILSKSLLMGLIERDKSVSEIVYRCTVCGGCDISCKYLNRLELYEIIQSLRRDLVESGVGPLETHRKYIKSVNERDNPYGEDPKSRFDWIPDDIIISDDAEILYFIGCTTAYREREIAIATMRILNIAKIPFKILKDEEKCCGSPVLRVGDVAAFKKIAKTNLSIIKRHGIKKVIFSCAGCFSTFNVDYRAVGKLPFEVIHTSQFFNELIEKGLLKPRFAIDSKVTYHDPCHLGRLSERPQKWWGKSVKISPLVKIDVPPRPIRYGKKGVYEEPRNVIKSIPGVELVEMDRIKEYSYCCGAGGGVKAAFPDFAIKTAQNRIKEAVSTGASVLISTCPFCAKNLRDGIGESDKIEFMDLSQFLLNALLPTGDSGKSPRVSEEIKKDDESAITMVSPAEIAEEIYIPPNPVINQIPADLKYNDSVDLDAFRESVYPYFAEILGEANVSMDPAILQNYAYNWCAELYNAQEGNDPIQFAKRPFMIVLPESTAQVRDIVLLCNRLGLRFKAFSTGFGPWNLVSDSNVVLIDLRRMNRIVEINKDGLYAVVEPYVTGAQLQVELMKFGLNCHMPGAGPQVSPLASSTSMGGPGFTSSSTGHSSRNMLGVEWVTPEGKIVRLGSAAIANNPQWFSGDGPGPSLRGIVRGYVGAMGGIGVFTKVGIKLYAFPTEVKWNVSGHLPDYHFERPKYMDIKLIDYPNLDMMVKAFAEIERAEITFSCFHNSSLAAGVVFTNYPKLLKRMTSALKLKRPLIVIITAHLESEYAYKQAVLSSIVNETGGKVMSDRNEWKIPSISYAEAMRSLFGFHAFVIGLTFNSTHGGADTLAMVKNMMERDKPLKKKYIRKGVIANDGGEGVWSSSFEYGHYYHAEMPTMYDQTKKRSVKGMAEYVQKADELDLVYRLGLPFFVVGDKMHEMVGPMTSNYHIWLRKIKEALDPNNVADSNFYIDSHIKKSE